MEPTRDVHYTLVDLLDRILDKGVVLYADIIISVAGIPLLGVNLRAALAGMETMLDYGIMQGWDERIRAQEREKRQAKEPIVEESITTSGLAWEVMTAPISRDGVEANLLTASAGEG